MSLDQNCMCHSGLKNWGKTFWKVETAFTGIRFLGFWVFFKLKGF